MNKPAGKPIVWIVMGALVLMTLVVIMMKPARTGQAETGGTVAAATSVSEIENSTIPGAQDESPNPPVSTTPATPQPGAAPAVGGDVAVAAPPAQ